MTVILSLPAVTDDKTFDKTCTRSLWYNRDELGMIHKEIFVSLHESKLGNLRDFEFSTRGLEEIRKRKPHKRQIRRREYIETVIAMQQACSREELSAYAISQSNSALARAQHYGCLDAEEARLVYQETFRRRSALSRDSTTVTGTATTPSNKNSAKHQDAGRLSAAEEQGILSLGSMGFHAQDARSALQATKGNVARAAELLLSSNCVNTAMHQDTGHDSLLGSDEQGIRALQAMGFHARHARDALQASNGSVDRAAQLLLDSDSGSIRVQQHWPATAAISFNQAPLLGLLNMTE